LDLGFPDIFAFVSDPAETPEYAAVAWEGDSRAVLQSFPEDVRQNFGFELWQLQQGERPGDYRPLPSIGLGVFELRDQDERAWYRVVYLSRINDVIYVLHCFEKKSREMPRKISRKQSSGSKPSERVLAAEKKHEKSS
jgi:phage-related protein